MKTLINTMFILILLSAQAYPQRIVFESNFETIPLQMPDSIPNGWWKLDVDHINPSIQWAVRDTSVHFGSGNTRPKAHNSRRALEIPWYAGNGGNFINDDWVWTDSFTVRQGDSVIWWMLIGSDSTFQPYIDTMQVYVCFDQDPSAVIQKLGTIRSLDSNNVWTRYYFNLSQFAGQRVYVAFRYNMDVSVDGLWCNIDDLFIGNHSAIGIEPISTEVPRSFALRQNYPNPFNPTTFIEFGLQKGEYVSLTVYNSLGQQVKTLVEQNLNAGSYKVDFNAGGLPSGAHYYRITAGDFSDSKKMMIVK